jgi:hypothetical protein
MFLIDSKHDFHQNSLRREKNLMRPEAVAVGVRRSPLILAVCTFTEVHEVFW